jgi:membrane-associated phospholipid phosphatase
MPGKVNFWEITIRGMSLKDWGANAIFCVLAAFFSSLMVIINRLNLPGEIHQVNIELDQFIPLVLPFVLAYLLYFPFVYGGWAAIFLLAPKTFRPYATAMMTIGLITGIVNIAYNTAAARAFVEPTDFLSRTLIWLYSLNAPTTALPSLHVSHSLCTGFFLSKIYPKLTGIWVFCVVLITLSTLFVKTHYLVDVIISIFLGIAITLAIRAAWDRAINARKPAQDKLVRNY